MFDHRVKSIYLVYITEQKNDFLSKDSVLGAKTILAPHNSDTAHLVKFNMFIWKKMMEKILLNTNNYHPKICVQRFLDIAPPYQQIQSWMP